MKKYIMEGFGTMFLVLAICMIGHPIAIGAMLTVLMYLGEHVSGAHYNPAITLAVWLRGKLKTDKVLPYMLFQVLGGIAAAIIYWMLAGQRYILVPATGISDAKLFMVELLFTFFLVFVFLVVMTTKKVKVNHIFGIVIGFALMAIAFLGGMYNPVVSIGSSILNLFFRGSVEALRHMPAYVLGTMSGGALAALFYRYMYCEEFK